MSKRGNCEERNGWNSDIVVNVHRVNLHRIQYLKVKTVSQTAEADRDRER